MQIVVTEVPRTKTERPTIISISPNVDQRMEKLFVWEGGVKEGFVHDEGGVSRAGGL
jgi:hypothetical protein